MEFQVGDIVLYKGNGIVSKLVKFFTKSEYTHVSMLISSNHIIEANWYKKSNIVRFEYDENTIEVYRIKGGLDYTKQIAIIQHSYDFLNKKYDYKQIFWYIYEYFFGKKNKNIFNSNQRLICSELVDKAYLSIGIDLVDFRKDGNVTPADIANGIKNGNFYKL
jgi:Orthopoxvirus protein of unknown function (DUF830).